MSIKNMAASKPNDLNIAVIGPGTQQWMSWLKSANFTLSNLQIADLVLWITPNEDDWDNIVADKKRNIVISDDPETISRCVKESVRYLRNLSDSDELRAELLQLADLPVEVPKNTFPTPPALKVLQKKETIKQQSKCILAALPNKGNIGLKLQQYIHKESAGLFRVLETVDSFKHLLDVADKNKFDVILVHRKLPGLEESLVENLRTLRNSVPHTRIIVVEADADYYTSIYKGNLEDQEIEWIVIPALPGPILKILQNTEEYEAESWDVVWNPEPLQTSAITVSETKIHRPLLIATHSAGGGIGKSTTALQLSFAFVSKGYKTLIIEFDSEKPSIARGTGISPNVPGLQDWMPHEDFKNETTALAAIKRTSRQINGLYVLPVGPVSSKKALLPFYLDKESNTVNDVTTMLNAALREFQIVIVDTNPILEDPPVFATLLRADMILYLLEGTKVFLDSTRTHLNEAEAHGIDTNRYRIILNKCTNKEPLSKREVTQTIEKPISLEVSLDIDGYRLAADKGRAYKPPKGVSPWDEYATKILTDVQLPVIEEEKPTFFSRLFKRKK